MPQAVLSAVDSAVTRTDLVPASEEFGGGNINRQIKA